MFTNVFLTIIFFSSNLLIHIHPNLAFQIFTQKKSFSQMKREFLKFIVILGVRIRNLDFVIIYLSDISWTDFPHDQSCISGFAACYKRSSLATFQKGKFYHLLQMEDSLYFIW